MNERLSDSEKEKLKNKIKESWNIPTSALLEKLSSEISKNFSNKKNPTTYKESIKKLINLENKIKNKTDIYNLEEELKNLSAHLSEKKKKEFRLAIEWAKEILKNSRDLIEDIKKDINIFTPKDWEFTTKIFWQKLLYKAKNPQNFWDQLIWWWIWLFNSSEAIAKISINLLIWIWKTIPDIYKIFSWKWEYDWFKDI